MAVAHKLISLAMLLGLAGRFTLSAEMRKDVEFARPGGVSLTLDASVPDMGAGPYPAVIIVHGGGFTTGDKASGLQPLFRVFTRARFVWFSINYRLAPQYPFPAATEDVISALWWVHAHAAEYKVDARRIVLAGTSAGGYLVDYAAAKATKEDHIAAVVSFYGPHDLLTQARVDAAIAAFTGVSTLNSNGEKRLREISPIYLLHHHMPPFLLIHGTADERVAFNQSVQFRRALQDHDTKVELIAVEGGKHGLENWEETPAQQEYKDIMIEWLRATLH